MASESFSDVVWADIGVTLTTGVRISGLDPILLLACVIGDIQLSGYFVFNYLLAFPPYSKSGRDSTTARGTDRRIHAGGEILYLRMRHTWRMMYSWSVDE